MRSTQRCALALAVLAAGATFPANAQQSPACARLETQLQSFDRGASDPARAEQIRRFEEAAHKQQEEIDRQQALGERSGCGGGGFLTLFRGEPAQCAPLKVKIEQMRNNLDRINADLERLQAGQSGPEREGQRRAILVALAQNDCGQQYKAALASAPPRRGSLFDSLFGPGTVFNPSGGSGFSSGSYRTICVRTCDGYYFPISYASTPDHFAEDEKACQKSCPAAEVMLFAHRNEGEDVSQAVSTTGQLYSTLPNAFKYRTAFDPSCSCRQPGESWAHALQSIDDPNAGRSDVPAGPGRAQPLAPPRVDAQGKPIKPEAAPAKTAPPPDSLQSAAAEGTKTEAVPVKPDPNRKVRAVGPTFLPAR